MFAINERPHVCGTNELSGTTACLCFKWTPDIVGSCTYCPLLGRASLKPTAHWGTLEQTRNISALSRQWDGAAHCYRLVSKVLQSQKRQLPLPSKSPTIHRYPVWGSERVVKDVGENSRVVIGGARMTLARRKSKKETLTASRDLNPGTLNT
jgi:hypothetical protein